MPYEVKGELACWVWTGYTLPDGTPAIRTRESLTTARRYYYEREYGAIPEGMELGSICANRLCVRPYHSHPRPRGETMRQSVPRKVGPVMEARMYELVHKEGLSRREVARRFGVADSTVRYRLRKAERAAA